MSDPDSSQTQALRVFEPGPGAVYSIEITARLTQIPRRTIAIYAKHGLVSPLSDQEGMFFDDEAIRLLRRIEQLRKSFGVNLPGIKFILNLLDELEARQAELRFRRG
jgi:DNA-binding transcriptional MerR regulator